MVYVFPNYDGTCSIHYQPDLLTIEEKARGIALQELPIAETPVGKVAILKANKTTGTVWYEYENSPEYPLEERVKDLEAAITTVLGGAV